jgi:hypothetical protein
MFGQERNRDSGGESGLDSSQRCGRSAFMVQVHAKQEA